MSLLRRRMMMQRAGQGFESVYDASDGGLPTDDGWERVGVKQERYVAFSNVDDCFTVNINHGGAQAYLYLPQHEQADNCSLEVEAAVSSTGMQLSLCGHEVFARAGLLHIGSSVNSRSFICFPTDDNGAPLDAVRRFIEADVFYTMRVEKRGNKCSFFLNDEAVAEHIDCKPLSEMTAYPVDERSSIRFTCATGYSWQSRGVAKIKKIIYREW